MCSALPQEEPVTPITACSERAQGNTDRDTKANIRLHGNQVVEEMENLEGRGGERWEKDETGARGVCFSRKGQAAIGRR